MRQTCTYWCNMSLQFHCYSLFPSNSESAVECEAPSAVCEWRERIVGIKTPNMIASGILIEDGHDCNKPSCRGRSSI
jgi:hypothetical protein